MIKKYIGLGILCLFININCNSQVADAISIISNLTGSLNELDVFISMDNSLKNLENLQEIQEKIKNADDWIDKMNSIKRAIILIESATCAIKDYDEAYAAYLGSGWTDDIKGSACLTGLDYQAIVTKATLIDDVMSQLTGSNDMTSAERDELMLAMDEAIQKLIQKVNAQLEELNAKTQYKLVSELAGQEAFSVNKVEFKNYESFGSIKNTVTGKNGFGGLALIIMRLALVLGLMPAIGGLTKGNYNMVIAWGVALIVVLVLSNLIN